eukprot:1133274-Alexandrium_andersonii.AAC.1
MSLASDVPGSRCARAGASKHRSQRRSSPRPARSDRRSDLQGPAPRCAAARAPQAGGVAV